jgi:integrase
VLPPADPRRRATGVPHMRIYVCRHAAATTWLRAGVGSRLGHSVDALVSTYVGTINGDDEVANTRIETALAVRS